jgi:hypothetical protein
MSDDVDDLLRHAMADLDRQVPDGYFDELPGRTLARLDDAPRLSAVPADAGEAGRRRRRSRLAIAGAAVAAAAVVTLVISRREPAEVRVATVEHRASAPPVAATVPPAPALTVPPPPPRDQPALDSGRAAGKSAVSKPSVSKSDAGAPKPLPKGKKLAKSEQLDRFALPDDEFRRGMAAIAPAARACFSGTRGTANVRLTVAPSGRVSEAHVVGEFAATPAGACVERAAAAMVFAPWQGEPQHFDYSYLLSD